MTAGKEVPFDFQVEGGAVDAVRLWVGAKDAKGSVKALASREGDHWHAHAEAPSPLPPGSRLWIEVEAGPSGKILLDLPLEPAPA